MGAGVLMNRILSDKERTRLLRLVRDLKSERGRPQKEVAAAAGHTEESFRNMLYGRKKLDEAVESAVYQFAISLGHDIAPYTDGRKRNLEWHARGMDQMNIRRDVLRSDVQTYRGTYLFYVHNGPDDIGVTCLTLYPSRPGTQWPRFTAWRQKFLVQGVYYFWEQRLFMIGHEVGEPYVRTYSLDPLKALPSMSFAGYLSTSGKNEHVTVHPCVAVKVARFENARSWSDLGKYSPQQLQERTDQQVLKALSLDTFEAKRGFEFSAG
jgi:hypothetical protein